VTESRYCTHGANVIFSLIFLHLFEIIVLICVDKCFFVILNFASLLQLVKWFCGKVWLEKCSSLEMLEYSLKKKLQKQQLHCFCWFGTVCIIET